MYKNTLLNALFTTNHEKDIKYIPYNNKHILGITSLWMCIPIYYGLYSFDYNIIILSLLLSCVCLVSTLFWSNPKGNSFLHKLDKICVWIFFITLLFINNNFILIGLIFILYIMSFIFFIKNYNTLQFISHLLFRYVFYWWCHIVMVPINVNFIYTFIIISIGYFSHVLLLYNINIQKITYWYSCILLLFWIYCNKEILKYLHES